MPPGQVQLEVIAKVEQALSRLSALEGKVRELFSLLGQTGGKVTLDVAQAETAIASVRDKLQALKNEAQTQGSIVLKADASQVLSAVQSAEAAVTASLARIKTTATQNPLAGLSESAQKETKATAENLDKLDKETARVLEQMKKRASENVFGSLDVNAQKEVAKLNAELKKLETAFTSAVNKLNTEARRANFDPASDSAKKLRENVRLAGEDILAFANKTKGATVSAGGDFGRLQAAVRSAQLAIRDFPKETDNLVQKLLNLSDKFATVGNAVRLFLASIVVQKLFDLGQQATEAAVKLELLRTALTGLLGSSTTADKQLAFLRKTAEDLGVSFVDLVERFRSFAPAATAAGLSLQATDDVFRSVAISARALGFSTEETQRALLAFQQILQKGKFQAEELTKQLGQLLPNAMGILQKELGKTKEELTKLLRSGELSAEAVLKLAAGLTEAFGPTAIGNAHTAASEIERFKNTIFDLKVAVGAELLPAVIHLLDALKDSGVEGKSAFESIGRAAGSLLEVVTRTVLAIKDVFTLNFRSLGFEIGGLLDDILEFALKPIINLSEAIVLGLHKVGIVSDETLDKAKERSKDLRKEIANIGEGYRGLADEARGNADRFADSWTGAAKRIEEENKASIKRLRKEYDEFVQKQGDDSEKLTKKEASELKKRESAFEGFFKAIQKLAEKPLTPTIGDPKASGADPFAGQAKSLTDFGQKIQDVHKELAKLLQEEQDLEHQTFINTEDVGRATDLRAKIGDLRNELKILDQEKAGGELTKTLDASGKAAAKLAKDIQTEKDKIDTALTELVAKNDEFAKSFLALDDKARAAVIGIVAEFQKINHQFGVTQADIERFGTALLAVFQRGGAVSADFAARMAQEFGAVTAGSGGAAAALRALAAEAQTADSGIAKLGGDAGTAAAGVDKLTAAANRQNAALPTAAHLVATVDAATGHWKIETEAATAATHAQGGALADVVNFLERTGQRTLEAKEAQTLFGLSLKDVSELLRAEGVDVALSAEKLEIIGNKAQGASDGFVKFKGQIFEVGDKAKGAGEELGRAGVKVDELGKKTIGQETPASIEKVGKAGETAGKGLDAAGKAADTAKPAMEAVATAAEKLAGAKTPNGLADGLVAIGAAAKVAAEPLKQAADGAARLGDGLAKVGSVDAEKVTALATAFTGLATPLTALADPASKAGTAFASIAESLEKAKTSAPEVAKAVGELGIELGKQVEAGTVEKYAASFEKLDPPLAASADHLKQMADSLRAFTDGVEPAAQGVERLVEGFGKLDLKAPTEAMRGLEIETAKLATDLGKVADDQGRAVEALKAGSEAIDGFKTKVGDLAKELRTTLHTAIATVALPDLQNLDKAIGKVEGGVSGLLDQLARLRSEGIPSIKATEAAVVSLTAALEAADVAAKKLGEDLAAVHLG